MSSRALLFFQKLCPCFRIWILDKIYKNMMIANIFRRCLGKPKVERVPNINSLGFCSSIKMDFLRVLKFLLKKLYLNLAKFDILRKIMSKFPSLRFKVKNMLFPQANNIITYEVSNPIDILPERAYKIYVLLSEEEHENSN